MRSIVEGRPRLGLIAAYLFTSLSFVAYLVAFSPLQSLAEPRALLGYLAASSTHHKGEWQKYKPQQRVRADCPDYDPYSRVPHGPYSDGPLSKVKSAPWTVSGVPFMRPSEGCRTFNSSAVEKVIDDLTKRIRDPDLAQLFRNTFPNTLDTTVKYFDPEENLAFIVTGDINAQWLRDTGGQFAHLYPLLPHDPELAKLVRAVINTEARYIAEYPYCGAFQPVPESGLAPTVNEHALLVDVYPPVSDQRVFECKWELDSLAGFLKIVRSYYQYTRDGSFVNDNFISAMSAIMRTIEDQTQSSWSDDWDWVVYYNWTGTPGSLSPPVDNGGTGEPRKKNGLVGCTHRPSDDRTIFNYITSVNAMLSVELGHLADTLDSLNTLGDVSLLARQYSGSIRSAIYANTLFNLPPNPPSNGANNRSKASEGGQIFAYETNGYGGAYLMDDTSVPSLVSLPYLGFLDREDETYLRTKEAMFSRANPYYAEGRIGSFKGIGSPHIAATNPWPMSQISGIFGASSDSEILDRLYLIVNSTGGLGLIHESINVLNETEYTRNWFAWANSYFAEMVLDLAKRKPGLILDSEEPYDIGQ